MDESLSAGSASCWMLRVDFLPISSMLLMRFKLAGITFSVDARSF